MMNDSDTSGHELELSNSDAEEKNPDGMNEECNAEEDSDYCDMSMLLESSDSELDSDSDVESEFHEWKEPSQSGRSACPAHTSKTYPFGNYSLAMFTIWDLLCEIPRTKLQLLLSLFMDPL
jgi:hypothetical protein